MISSLNYFAVAVITFPIIIIRIKTLKLHAIIQFNSIIWHNRVITVLLACSEFALKPNRSISRDPQVAIHRPSIDEQAF